jgi:hypothetical protein
MKRSICCFDLKLVAADKYSPSTGFTAVNFSKKKEHRKLSESL